MDDERRADILAAFERHSSSFDQLARRRGDVAWSGVIAPPSTARASGAPDPSQPELTARMVDVLGLIADGYSNKDIGSRLSIGAETVKSHIARLLTTLGARNRAHAVAIAFRSGLLTGSGRFRAA